ncbi:MAG TPA: phenylalanine--tRNA ligase subunit alpha [Candidatus Woesebacteria bacterium]|nr:phenylalanine--tRNA ligase subunit alpha [Candidatus Woesebacteria bacterium]HPR99856.1 phenylalanine--tRNA ligase subunit alpha [Candidatus Woesebacteria bacterium]
MDLDKVLKETKNKIDLAKTSAELENIRIELLGRLGLINKLFSEIKNIENPREYGQLLNKLKNNIETLLKNKSSTIPETENYKLKIEDYFSLPKVGHLHPLTQTERQLNKVFQKLGFSIYASPEIVTDEYNFTRLNVPANHPARDMQDTIYIKEPQFLLRTQTSTIESYLLQAQNKNLPIRAAFPGSVYRNEKVNRSNHFIFQQYQAVVVDKNVTMKDLIGTMDLMFKTLYGPKVIVRYRCKYYPEVEPGVGPDMQCFSCHGKGCSLCKYAGWIEMGGSGIIHPNVLKAAGIDPKIWSGFAFGMGLDRWTMAKNNIKDIRTLRGGNLAYKPNSNPPSSLHSETSLDKGRLNKSPPSSRGKSADTAEGGLI